MSMEISDRVGANPRRVRVWDFATRAIHWLFAALIPFLWWTERNDEMRWHVLAGIGVASLLVLRLFLGLFGSETSRFSDFVRGPRAAWDYVRGRSDEPLGHSPIGGWSVVLLLGLLATEVVLGLFTSDEDGLESGPFADYLGFDRSRIAANFHGIVFQALVVAICVHVAAVVFYLLRGKNLIAPMLTGSKQLQENQRPPKLVAPIVLAIGLALAAITYAVLWHLDAL
jgi:cytochrome b